MSLPTIEAFERGAIDPETFDHEAHVYLAWSYLRRYDLLESIRRYRDALRRLTQQLGAQGKYNETITWFYLVSIAERLAQQPVAEWAEFRRRNADLLAAGGQTIGRYYSSARLHSIQARQNFVLPDRSPPIDA